MRKRRLLPISILFLNIIIQIGFINSISKDITNKSNEVNKYCSYINDKSRKAIDITNELSESNNSYVLALINEINIYINNYEEKNCNEKNKR